MAAFAATLYEHPERFPPIPVPTPDELQAAGKADGPTLHYLPATKDVKGPAAEAENALLGNLESMFSVMYTNIPEISSIYTAHESGANIGYDRNASLKTGIGAFDCRSLDWYTSVKATGKAYFSKTYADSFGRGLTVTLAQPILVNRQFSGVLGVDILIEDINREILNTRYGAGGYAMLFDKDGGVISAKGLSEENRQSASFLGTKAEDALEAMRSSESGRVESDIDGRDVYILYAPVSVAGWKLAVVMPVEETLRPATQADQAIRAIGEQSLRDMDGMINRLYLIMLGLFLILSVVCVILVQRVCDRVARPILTLSKDVGGIGEGNLNYHNGIRTGMRLEALGASFERMTASLRAYIDNLTRVTAERERLGAELNVATRIQASMLPCIFRPSPTGRSLTCTRRWSRQEVGGDFYDFFMVDEDHLYDGHRRLSGKGIPAALFMMTSKTLLQTLAQTGCPPRK
jgi:sigma-B regulation protein RsbU (phosphoserine phosphatase)